MSTSDLVQINPQIVHELIQGEVVAINLATGCYYSLTGIAAEIWSLLAEPAEPEELADLLAARYGSVAADHKTDIVAFIAQLREEELVVSIPNQPERAHRAVEPADPARFAVPTLQKYGDMRNLLLIDPIHEVGESGWPARPANAKQSRRYRRCAARWPQVRSMCG